MAISNKKAFRIVYTKTVTFANMASRSEYFRQRYAHKKYLNERAALVERYLETVYPKQLEEARFYVDTELARANTKIRNAPEDTGLNRVLANTEIRTAPKDTGLNRVPEETLSFDEIQNLLQPLLEPLDLPEEFFNSAPAEAERTVNAEETVNVAQEDNPSFEAPADLDISLDSGIFEDLDIIFTDIADLF